MQTKLTEPKRSAVEQLLLSTAADRSIEQANLAGFSGRTVFVNPAYFDSIDKEYVLGAIRDALSSNGALLVQAVDQADVIVEPRSGALSIDSSDSLVGLPSIPVPVPMVGTFLTPELPLYKAQRQNSTAKIALLAYERESREHFHSSGSLIGEARIHYYQFIGYIRYTRTDLPERQIRRRWRGE